MTGPIASRGNLQCAQSANMLAFEGIGKIAW